MARLVLMSERLGFQFTEDNDLFAKDSNFYEWRAS